MVTLISKIALRYYNFITQNMNDTVITVLVVVVLIIVMSFFSLKAKNDSWEGTLIKKKAIENEDSMVTVYKLTFKTVDGKTKHITVNKTNPEVFLKMQDTGKRRENMYRDPLINTIINNEEYNNTCFQHPNYLLLYCCIIVF